MSAERRLNARRILYSPEYLDMGADNGGVVVNLSEGGIGFHAVGPVIPDVEIPVSFSLGTGYRIDVKARVVWVGDKGKMGGAVFGKLSKDSRSLIREWLAKSEFEQDSEEEPVATQGQSTAVQQAVEAAAAAPAAPIAETANPVEETMRPEPVAESHRQTAAQNGVVLPPNVQPPPEPPPAASFPAHEIASTPTSVSNAAIPEPVAAVPVMQNPPAPALDPETTQSAEAASANATPIFTNQPETPAVPVRPEPLVTSGFVAPERTREQTAGTSFSAVPSISAWNKGNASAGRGATPQPKAAGELFPPRNAENIFARSSSQAEFESGPRRGSVLMVIAIIIAAGAIAAYYARGHRQQIGNAIVHVGNSVAGTPAASATEASPSLINKNAAPGATSSSSAPASNNVPTSASQAPTITPTPSEPAKSKPTSQTPSATPATAPTGNAVQAKNGTQPATTPSKTAKGQTATNASNPASSTSSASAAAPYPGQTEYQRAENYLNGKGVDKDPAEAAEWFWRSLEAGNTTAALPLADLYLQGNGVSRSCTQARILLDAAAQKNNQEAIHKLAELPENCQ